MLALDMTPVPSVATLARIFREKGVARAEPKKKPRSAWRRFVYPAPNACWQLDATEYVLAGGRKRVIFQLIDDHSRLAIASHVARRETAQAALAVVDKGITAHGVPQRLLSDNGVALNPSRRGYLGRLVIHLRALGVTPITGKPGKPTTQGKNERFHQTLFRWLDKQPLAATLRELQAQVDLFDHIYNTQRPDQALPGRITPQQAWDATPAVQAPVGAPGALRKIRATKRSQQQPTGTSVAIPPAVNSTTGSLPFSAASSRRRELYREASSAAGVRLTTVRRNGVVRVRKVEYQIGRRYAGQTAYVLAHADKVEFYDHQGTQIIEHPWPPPGTTYVAHTTPPPPASVTDVLTHEPSPES